MFIHFDFDLADHQMKVSANVGLGTCTEINDTLYRVSLTRQDHDLRALSQVMLTV